MAYPGPIPLDEQHASRLYGREVDVERLLNATLGRKVVEVTATSGTGKSSLLMAGLRPALEKRGLVVPVLRSWADVSGADAGAYYLAAVRRAFVESGIDRDWTGDVMSDLEALDVQYGSDLVLLFDQLEELLRLDPLLGRQFIGTTVTVAKDWPFRQVLSLRSEYKEELNVLEESLSRLMWTYLPIRSIEERHEPLVVESPAAAAGWTFTREARDQVVEIWRRARSEVSNIGLLHLQAMLWVIERQLFPAVGSEIGIDALQAEDEFLLAKVLTSDLEAADCVQVTTNALHTYAELRITELTKEHGDTWAAREVRFAIARVASELSSAGYKISRGTVELFFRAFDGLEDLQWNREVVATLLVAVSDWSFQSDTIRTPTATDVLAIARQHGNTSAELGGNSELLSGRLAGYDSLPGLAELIVVFESVLDWLERASIARVTKDLQGRRFVTLVHDGYGPAMSSWGRRVLSEPKRYLEAPVGSRGNVVLPGAEVDGGDGMEFHGLRWPGCVLPNARLRRIRFIECDFRGAIFRECEFEDVTFERCSMPGALFLDSRFLGDKGCVLDSCETRTLTVRRVMMSGGGLVVHGTRSDGLFLDDVTGGPWTVTGSSFRHLSVVGADAKIGPGYVADGSVLTHVHIEGESAETTVTASTLRYVDTTPGMLTLASDAVLEDSGKLDSSGSGSY